jgi:CRISPR/Cas system endoribonuclease Cas6 (RAMP superfamily)
MRLYLKLTRNQEIIPFNYQSFLTGTIHKWIGDNNSVHDEMSMYSFSWFQNAEAKSSRGINLTANSYFFISAYDETFMKNVLKGILDDPFVCFGVSVSDVQIVQAPQFSGVRCSPWPVLFSLKTV